MVLGETLRQTAGFPVAGSPKGLIVEITLFQPGGLVALAQVLMIDIVLAGDNAVVIGLAAARVPVAMRKKVIFWGLVAAVVLRIAMAVVAVKLLAVIGLVLAGGILLLWVCWRMSATFPATSITTRPRSPPVHPPSAAILQIIVADISMSLDDVLAVAGADRDRLDVLVIGLLMSVGLIGATAACIAKLLERHRWIPSVGLAMSSMSP